MAENTLMKEYNNLKRVIEQYQSDLIKEYNSQLGNTNHTLVVDFVVEGDKLKLIIVGPDEVEFIDKGRRSGKFPPTNVLQEWVQKKGLATELPRVKQLAFLIGRSIAEKGTSGNHLLDKIFGELLSKYASQLQSALEKDVEEDTKEMETKINDMLSKVL